jgi:hypothetical protein
MEKTANLNILLHGIQSSYKEQVCLGGRKPVGGGLASDMKNVYHSILVYDDNVKKQ